VAVNNLFYGMSPGPSQPRIARTQLFFIDSSRTRLQNLSEAEQRNDTAVFDAEPVGMDDRRAAVFHASRPGAQAIGMKGLQTVFSQGLLECLSGAAGVPIQDPDGSLNWWVTINSLVEALGPVFEGLNAQYEPQGAPRQSFEATRLIDSPLVRLDGPPEVPVRVRIEPPGGAEVVVLDATGKVVAKVGPTGPTEFRLPAGFYTLQKTVSATGQSRSHTRSLKPPRADWLVTAGD
jgi:hypothetical protein